MSTSLQNMQREFLHSLLKQDALPIQAALLQKPVSELGLKAYMHAYSSRLMEALNNDHPCLGAYLGDTLWQQMCTGYIEKHPSQHRSLRNFGDHLPDYLLYADGFKENPEIAELAQLERQLLNCFDAPDARPIDFSELIALDAQQWPVLKLSFHPSLQLLNHQYNSMAIWQAMKVPEAPPSVMKADQSWLLWRDAERVTHFRSASDDEAVAFNTFLHDGNFSLVCERLSEIHAVEEVPQIALNSLNAWCHDGWIIGTR